MKRPWELNMDEIVWMGETLATLTHDQRRALTLYFDSLAVQAYRNGDQARGKAFEEIEEALHRLIDEALPEAEKQGGQASVVEGELTEPKGKGGKKKPQPPSAPKPEQPKEPLDAFPDALDEEDIRAVLAAASPKAPTLVAARMSQSRGIPAVAAMTNKPKAPKKRR